MYIQSMKVMLMSPNRVGVHKFVKKEIKKRTNKQQAYKDKK